MVGTGKGAENGVLIRSGEALERAHKINTIVFDKTGTLTKGKPEVTDIVSAGFSEMDVLLYAASAEKGSEHPLGEAIIKKALDKKLETRSPERFSAVPGHGIKATVNGKQVMLGNEKLMQEEGTSVDLLKHETVALSEQGKNPMFVSVDNRLPRSSQCVPPGDPVAPGRLVFYTQVKSPIDTTVQHRWYYGRSLIHVAGLRVRANTGSGYRTFSRNTLSRERSGDWRVELRTQGGELLHEARFVVR